MGQVLVWMALFATLGWLADGATGVLWGAFIGWLLGLVSARQQRKYLQLQLDAAVQPLVERVAQLEQRFAKLTRADRASQAEVVTQSAPVAATQGVDAQFASAPDSPPPGATTVDDDVSTDSTSALNNQAAQGWGSVDGSAYDPRATLLGKLYQRLICFFTDGNLVVRVGVLVLFFGVAFLLRYASERNLISIELRLTGIVLAAIVVLLLGWRFRHRPGHYGLVLQGGAIGVLYLTVYAAAKLYALLPMGLAFALMAAIVAFSALLAVLQNARSLALFASAGGFLAPVLASTGSGSHVALFSYYTLLNLGIFAIAWVRSWRELNLLGFGFTFVIGSAWGYQYYQPEHFATTEPFLVLFFLLYTSIAILFAQRQPAQKLGYVDGSLVFGVPIVAFTLQAALVRDIEFGLAISALVMAAFYIVLTRLLWQRFPTQLKMLFESFLALGVVFASLAIPLALDGRWTAAAWALEGAALVWVGVRQQRRLAPAFGVALQFAAGVAFLLDSSVRVASPPVVNGVWLGACVVAFAALFSSWWLSRHLDTFKTYTQKISVMLLLWGLGWWMVAGLREIDIHLQLPSGAHAVLVLLALTAGTLTWASKRLHWSTLGRMPIALLPILYCVALGEFAVAGVQHGWQTWGLLAWGLAVAAHLYSLWHAESHWPVGVVRLWHPAGLWLLVGLLTWELDWLIRASILQASTWHWIAWALTPGVVVALVLRWGGRMGWPINAHFNAYIGIGLGALAVYLWGWSLLASLHAGDPAPLSFVPLLNPLDLAQGFALLAALGWMLWWRSSLDTTQASKYLPVAVGGLAIAGFVWLNAIVARTIHFWAKVDWRLADLQHSVLLQTSIAILWTLTAMLVMVIARRWVNRHAWYVGAGLLGAVVVKLFLVDLSGAGTLARIVSFLVVGGLMLVIGYYAPLPPKQQEEVAP